MSHFKPCLFMLILLLAGCAAPSAGAGSASTPTPKTLEGDEALRRDAETMAHSLGISMEEALRRGQLQDTIGQLGAQLEAKEADTFAGLWIQQTPNYRVVVAFTKDGEQSIRRYVANTALAGIVEVRQANVTLATLKNAQQNAIDLLRRLDLNIDSGINIQENRVEVYVTDRALFDATLQKANAQLPDHVTIITVYKPLGNQVPFPITPDPSIHMPQLKMRSSSFMLALAIGKLVVKDSCLRVEQDDTSTLIIWQPDYFVNNNKGIIEILDRRGQVVARVGEEIQIGGGEVPLTPDLQRQLREPIPTQCGGPYWLMGDLVRS